MEALGPILALMFEPEFLRSCVTTFWLDNLSALSGFVLGSSKAADLGALVFGAHLCFTKRGIRAWWDYVPSASNIADEAHVSALKIRWHARLASSWSCVLFWTAYTPWCTPRQGHGHDSGRSTHHETYIPHCMYMYIYMCVRI